jgi:hypothetical protein
VSALPEGSLRIVGTYHNSTCSCPPGLAQRHTFSARAQKAPTLPCTQSVPLTFPKNAYLSHSIRCHMQTVQKVTYNLDHRPARELAQQCFLQSVVYSHNLNSKVKGRGSYFHQNASCDLCMQAHLRQQQLAKHIFYHSSFILVRQDIK